MSLVTCPTCGKRISPAAAVCIGCGGPIAGRFRAITGWDAALVLLSLLGGFALAWQVHRWSEGDVILVAIAFMSPIIGSLVFASRSRSE